MAEHVLHDLQVGASGERERRGAMPQVVQPDRRQARLGGQRLEGPGEPVRRERVPVETGEHVPAGVIGVSGLRALGLLQAVVPAQRRDGSPVQGDDPLTVRCFGRGDGQVTVVFLELAADDSGAAVQVEVLPAQPACLAAAQAAQRDQVKHRVQPV